MLFCSYVILLLRDQRMFESLNEAIGLPFSRKLHFTSKKKWLVAARNLQIYEFYTFLTLKLSQYCKSDSTFSSS